MERLPKRILVLLHHQLESIGIIADALRCASVVPHPIRSFEGQAPPKELADAAGLVIMGGPQSVYNREEYPYLRSEIRLIDDALKHEKPVLGVCLGSQLLAAALGAIVYPASRKELGWNRVTLSEAARNDSLFSGSPRSFTAFHWHADVFDLPHGAVPLASSAVTENQAFRYGRGAYGLLFHMEVTFPLVRTMVETFSGELDAAGLNGAAIKLNAHTHLPALQQIGHTVFRRWSELLQ
jgi:GMP synthase (glutamine-hydrolysing)